MTTIDELSKTMAGQDTVGDPDERTPKVWNIVVRDSRHASAKITTAYDDDDLDAIMVNLKVEESR